MNCLSALFSISLDLKIIIRYIFAFDAILGNVYQSDHTSRRGVAEASESNWAFNEFFALMTSHILSEVGVNIPPDKCATWATQSPVASLKVSWRIDLVNLVALVRIPSAANHGCGEGVLVWVDDLSHHSGSRFYRRKSTELWGLNVHVVANIAGDSARVRWSSRPLTIDALVDGLKLIWNTISYVHVL